MIEININKINKNYGFNSVLNDFSFELKTHERIGLIGCNGCGKTTVLRLIKGLDTCDEGSITIRKDANIGYLSQIPGNELKGVTSNDVFLRGVEYLIDLNNKINNYIDNMDSSEKSIKKLTDMQEEYRIKGGFNLNEKINKIKNGFKLTEDMLNLEYNSLSGGEKTIINLASLILSNPDILLLDEPTNHLDIDTLQWLEEYLINYKGSIVIVSHDRYFLDKVVTKIVCIEKGKEEVYHGNYSYYSRESEKRMMLEFESYKNQQKKIKAMQEAIKRLKEWGERSDNPIFFRRAASIEKRLDKLDVIDKPMSKIDLPIDFNVYERGSNNILTIKNFDLNIGNKQLLIDANMNIYLHDRVCLLGKNGAGKTTLIKNIINNTHDNIKLGSNIVIGYIPQEIKFDNEELTIYEHMRNIFVGNEAQLRSKLYRFYFGNDTISKKLKSISGGEKVRIKLLELVLKNANFLILDEPTNHIDIDTRELLESSLLNFDGTILFISHDRYFINKIATRIIRFENKSLVSYDGNYDSIKDNKIEIIQKNKEEIVNLKGSNRLNEFLDGTKIKEMSIGCSKDNVYKIKKGSRTFYLKISDHLSEESMRLDYLKNKILISKKIFYEKHNNKSYILTESLKGQMLCNDYYINNPIEAIKIIVESFNALYNVDYSDCIFNELIDIKLNRIKERLRSIDVSKIRSEYIKRFVTVENMYNYLMGNKPKAIIGFTHGDMSLPNIFGNNGHFSGLLDVGECGISDIYYDIVICEISIERNYGKEYVNKFYEELGIEKDDFKSDYYRIMMEL